MCCIHLNNSQTGSLYVLSNEIDPQKSGILEENWFSIQTVLMKTTCIVIYYDLWRFWEASLKYLKWMTWGFTFFQDFKT